MATKTINLGRFHVESVDRIQFTLTKDGEPWLNVDSVDLTFENPDRETTFTRSMVLSSGAVWYYDTTTTDITEAGAWTLKVKPTDGAIVKSYPYEISMDVVEQP